MLMYCIYRTYEKACEFSIVALMKQSVQQQAEAEAIEVGLCMYLCTCLWTGICMYLVYLKFYVCV
jgi:uncharacterized membrane-anchored protein